MKRYLCGIFGVLLLVGVASSARADEPAKADVVAALQKGGYVLFIRHPKTVAGQTDTDPQHLDNIKAQRQLSDEGRKQAKDLGEALRALRIPVGSVLSSKFWRAQEAAKLLAVGHVEATLDVSEGGHAVSAEENERRASALRKLLGTAPAKGKNVVVMSHKPNLLAAEGNDFGDLSEAEVVIFEPLGDGKAKLVARVPAATWTAWTK